MSIRLFARPLSTSLAFLIGMTLTAATAGAQVVPNPIGASLDGPAGGQGLEPGEYRPELPKLRDTEDEEEDLELPSIEVPTPATPRLDAGLSVLVDRFEVEGSTVFSDEELAEVLAPWTGRTIQSEELLDARDALTRFYVDRGYATSGAIVPDQEVAGGVVRLQVIEGRVSQIEIRGNRRFRDLYFHQRLDLVTNAPVNLSEVEEVLRIFQRDVWIERVDAEIEPGDRFGESRLVVIVTETPQWRASVEAGNERSPSIGSWGGIVEGRVSNLTGLGDVLTTRFQATEGSLDFEGLVEMPITPWDTRLRLRARITETELQESPFDSLNIESKARTYGVSLLHPAYRSEADELWLELSGEWRETKSTIMGEAFCFELVIEGCSRPRISVIRAGMQWTHRTRHDAIAARTLFSFGVDALNATTGGPESSPDGEFFAWLGQAQWAHVFPESWRAPQLLLRADAQLVDDPLLSMEQIAVGGRLTVRGYRENQLVRDNAVILSGEVRVPLFRDSLRRPLVELVPFMDWGRAWNHAPGSPTDTLWSLGAGLRFTVVKGVLGEVYWGGRLEDVSNPNDALQDHGVHMRLRIDAPDVF